MYKFSAEKRERVMSLRKRLVESCPECKGTGYLPVESHPGTLKRCGCMVVLKYLMELVIANIPVDYWRLSVDDLEIDSTYKATVKFYLENLDKAIEKGMGLTFLGPNGVGKTSLMCEIGKTAIVAGYQVRYFTLSSYITHIQKSNSDEQNDMEEGQLLLIDELDKKYQKKGSDFVIKALDESLRKFLGAGKTLILCTNWNEEEIKQNFGESTVSLLKRRCDFMEMVGEDYSKKLQSNFWEELREEPNYFCENILDAAWELEESRDE